ncbi:hypothetical protein [Sphingopyxis sp. PET50]|uniref:hypothetical protein n=1 Tax=Sphingopyxis sp. PET50 TaxID=2976533 RepID=UPI0021AF523C|nr:hypothetical protein [Sphingopyxis sp. PET50]
MSAAEHPLWIALRDYRVGPAGAALTFEAKLAREHGWSADHAAAVMHEYRRFLFLAMTMRPYGGAVRSGRSGMAPAPDL